MKSCPYCAEQIQDAAIVCRFCNRSLAPVAATEPEPSRPPAKPPMSTAMRVFWFFVAVAAVVVLVFVLVIWAALSGSSSQTPGATASTTVRLAPLDYEVSGTHADLIIKNLNQEAWIDAKLAINDDFLCDLGQVAVGASVTINTRECVDDGGRRFSPLTRAVTKVQLQARRGDQWTPDFKTRRVR